MLKKKYFSIPLAFGLCLMHTIPTYADSSVPVENIYAMQMDSSEKVLDDVSDIVHETMDAISIQKSEINEDTNNVYIHSEPVYYYTEQVVTEPVMTTIEVPYEWIYGDTGDSEQLIPQDNQDEVNEAQANYDAALAAYESALAEYEAASQIVESTREEEVEVTEEVEDEEGNLITETRTEIQTVTETSYAGDVETAQANLDAAQASLDEARVQLDSALNSEQQIDEEPVSKDGFEEASDYADFIGNESLNKEAELLDEAVSETYIEQQSESSEQSYSSSVKTVKQDVIPLEGVNLTLYNLLIDRIKQVAEGQIDHTEFEFSPSELGLEGLSYTAEQLGVSDFRNVDGDGTDEASEAYLKLIGLDIDKVADYVDLNCSYAYTYWKGFEGGQSLPHYYTDNGLSLKSFTVSMYVSPDYSKTGDSKTFDFNTDMVAYANTALQNARNIVDKYADKSDYDKLKAYKDEICELTSYNHEAVKVPVAERTHTNPWKMIWVFDGDDSTNVICKGYAEAFAYLCSISTFQNPNLDCYVVTGNIGDEGHAWNIVTFGNGNNYLVDATNCDSGTDGYPDGLFLVGSEDGSVSEGYKIKINLLVSQTYTYSDYALKMYPVDKLTLNTKKLSAGGIAGENITWTLDDDGVLTVSGSGDMANYTNSTTSPWGKDIKRVIIQEGITSVGDYAFQSSKIESIYIPSSIKKLGQAAFLSCSSLMNVTLPEGLKTIGPASFGICSSLTSVTIPSSVTSIGNSCFNRCSNLEKVTFLSKATGNTVKYADDYSSAFVDCSKLKTAGPIGSGCNFEFNWSDVVPYAAFAGCTYLTEVVIPEGITKISGRAFHGCFNLSHISIPSSVTECGQYRYSVIESVFSQCTKLLTAGPIGSGCNIEYGWTESIPSLTFAYSSLISVVIADGISTIRESAFCNCSKLSKIIMPSSVRTIEGSNFSRSIVTSAGPIGSGCDYEFGWEDAIAYGAFCNLVKLTRVELPSSITKIGDFAFHDCVSLTNITIPSGVTYIGTYAFGGCKKLESIFLPSGITSIENGTCASCESLTELSIPSSVTSIGSRAFEGCTSIQKLIIPSSVTNIGSFAFSNMIFKTAGPTGSGNDLEFPWTDSIPDNAFCGLKKLTSIDLPENITKIGALAFTDCQSLTSFNLPNGLDHISKKTFAGCTGLINIVIPSGVTSIGEGAFTDCTSLISVHMPISVKQIDRYAFIGLPKPSHVYYYGTQDDWGKVTQERYEYKTSSGWYYTPFNSMNTTIHYLGINGAAVKINNGYIPMYDVDHCFEQTSYRYDHDLAKYAAGLSVLTYSNDVKNIENGLTALGYEYLDDNFNATRYKEFYSGDYSPVSFGLRYIEDLDATIVVAAIRGTYHEEWLTNWDAGFDEEHGSFKNAATEVYAKLYNYILKNTFNIKGTLKILVTGHSRGAATANIVAAYLDDPSLVHEDLSKIDVDIRNVYAYTFATPNTTKRKTRDDSLYQNIFNIVNPEDFVTKVVPSDWGYGRFGHTFVLPTKQTMTVSGYSPYLESVRSYYSAFNVGNTYNPYPLGMFGVSAYVKLITTFIGDEVSYQVIPIGDAGSLYMLYRFGLGGLLSENPVYMALSGVTLLNAVRGGYGALGAATLAYFFYSQGVGMIPGVNNIVGTYFGNAHESESYLAMISSIDGLEGFRNSQMYGIVNCPVDISVYNSAGTLVGQIINNVVQEGNEIWMHVDGDSKIYYLPEGDTYRVELSGNDTGTMDYSIVTEDTDTYAQNRTYHEALELNTEKVYTTDDASVYTILSSDETEIDPTAEFDIETGKKLKIDITVEGRGSAPSLSNLTPGDYVTLHAVTDSNNEFYGWYDMDGNLVSSEKEYSFSIHGDMSFTAKFSDVFVPMESMAFEEDSVTIYKQEEYYNNLTIGPENASAQKLIWTTSNEKIVTVDNGVIRGISDGTATITASLEDGSISASYTVTVRKDPVNKSSHSISLEGNIGVNFYMDFSDVVLSDEGAVVEFTMNGNTTTQRVKDAVKSGTERRFSVDVSASQMTEDIGVKVILSDGRTIYTEKYSVKQYCDRMLAKDSTKAELKALMEALLNYGAYSQIYFGYQTDNLANSGMTDTDVSDVTVDKLLNYKSVKTGSEEGLTFKGSSLDLRSYTSIRHYFAVGEGHTIDEYTFTVDGKEAAPAVSGDLYFVEIPNIASPDLDHMFTLTAGGFSIQYGALSYAYNQIKKDPGNATLKDTCRALYKYNQAAKIYFKKA